MKQFIFMMVIYMTISHSFAQMPAITAHRGASYDAPENTLSAFKLAWKQGADAIEGDFHLTKDKEVVCIHDADTGRVAKEKWIVAQSTYEELRKLDVGSWKGTQWAGERIPTLKEVLQLVPAGKKIFLEVKSGVEIIPHLVKIFMESSVSREQIVIISFSLDIIAEIKKYMPEIKAYWLTSFRKEGEVWKPSISEIVTLLKKVNADGLDCKAHESIDENFAKSLKYQGFEFHIWTVDNVEIAKRFQSLGVNSITTNRPLWLREHLEQKE